MSTDNEKPASAPTWKTIGNYQEATLPDRTPLEVFISGTIYAWNVFRFLFMSFFLVLWSMLTFLIPVKKKSIKGSIAVVTGGGNGLGKALATELVRNGAKVAVVDLDGKAAQNTAEMLCSKFKNEDVAKPFVVDVSNPEAVKNLRDQILMEYGKPATIIVNNAGLMPSLSLLEGTDDDIKKVIEVNILSQIWMLRAFLPAMKAVNEGHILTISSISAEFGMSRAITYSATKSAIKTLTLALKDELLDFGYNGIHVSIAYPFFLATRKAIVDVVVKRVRPTMPEVAAKTIISGMLKNTIHISVPITLTYLAAWMKCFPEEVFQCYRRTFNLDDPPK